MAARVLVVDDHPVVLEGVTQLLEAAGLSVAGSTTRSEETVRLARKLKPDVVLLDVRMPGKDGFDVLEALRASFPDLPVVMFSGFSSPTYMARAVAAGAHDYLLKEASAKQLVTAVAGAAERKPPAASSGLRRMAATMADRSPPHDAEAILTPRESQVLRQVALGLSNKEIAQTLEISVETVKEHVQNLLRKLAVTDRTQAAVWAVRHGIG